MITHLCVSVCGCACVFFYMLHCKDHSIHWQSVDIFGVQTCFNGCRTGFSWVRGSYSGEKQTYALVHSDVLLPGAHLLDAAKKFGPKFWPLHN